MAVTFTKIGRSRYKTEAPKGGDIFIFKDSYTGLWRVKEDGGPVDWFGPFATLKEAKDRVERAIA